MKNRSNDDARAKMRAWAEGQARKGKGGSLSLPDGKSLLKLDKPRMSLDIVPYVVKSKCHPTKGVKPGDIWWERLYWTHRNIGPQQETVICPSSFGKPCPVCEDFFRLQKDPHADDDVVKALRRKERQVFNAIDRMNKEKGIQILDSSTFLFGDLLVEETRDPENEEYALFWQLSGGFTLKLRFKEDKSGGFSSWKATRLDFAPRKDLPESLLKKAVELDKVIECLGYDELKELYLGGDVEDTKAGKKHKKHKDDDEDQDEEDEDNLDLGDEDEDEDEKPKAKRRIPKSEHHKAIEEDFGIEDEDEDDTESDDDDEDDESEDTDDDSDNESEDGDEGDEDDDGSEEEDDDSDDGDDDTDDEDDEDSEDDSSDGDEDEDEEAEEQAAHIAELRAKKKKSRK